mgnify:CR=1 FL=1
MSFFVQNLSIYAAKNRAWKKLTEYVGHFEYVLIRDECSRDALVEELRAKVEEINAECPKLKPIRFSAGNNGEGCFRMDASVNKMGCPDMIFTMNIVKIRSVYQFSENLVKGELS